jgi:DNA-binding transcriptional regulator YdaS (Cro superfamily)
MDVQVLVEKAGGVSKMAARCGVSHSTVCGWKRGNFLPGNRVRQIAELLTIPVEALLPMVRTPVSRKASVVAAPQEAA